jgi:hypothetical protein
MRLSETAVQAYLAPDGDINDLVDENLAGLFDYDATTVPV